MAKKCAKNPVVAAKGDRLLLARSRSGHGYWLSNTHWALRLDVDISGSTAATALSRVPVVAEYARQGAVGSYIGGVWTAAEDGHGVDIDEIIKQCAGGTPIAWTRRLDAGAAKELEMRLGLAGEKHVWINRTYLDTLWPYVTEPWHMIDDVSPLWAYRGDDVAAICMPVRSGRPDEYGAYHV